MRFNVEVTVLLLSMFGSCTAVVVPELAFLPTALDAVEEGVEAVSYTHLTLPTKRIV